MSFANKLKDIVAILFGWPRHLLEGDTDESRQFRETPCEYWSKELGRPTTPRWVLQVVGTECFRDTIHPDIWISALKRDMLSHKGDIVITDVRFPNEMQAIRDLGGKIVVVERGGVPAWYYIAIESNRSLVDHPTHKTRMHLEYPQIHESEWRWLGIPADFYADNSGDFAGLSGKVSECLKSFSYHFKQ